MTIRSFVVENKLAEILVRSWQDVEFRSLLKSEPNTVAESYGLLREDLENLGNVDCQFQEENLSLKQSSQHTGYKICMVC